MKIEYHFKILKSTWGISINLIAEDLPYMPFYNDYKVINGVFLRIGLPFKIHEVEKDFIVAAILRLSDQIHERIYGQEIVIQITDIEFDHTDYQPEGLYMAMLGWLSKRYDIPLPVIDITYNSDLRKYEFHI